MSMERKTPKPIEVRQRPRRIAETEAVAEPLVQTLLTVPDLRKRELASPPAAPALAAEVPIVAEIPVATTAPLQSNTGTESQVQVESGVSASVEINPVETLSAASAVCSTPEPEQHLASAIAPPQDVIGPNGKRKQPAAPRGEVNSDLTRRIKSLLGHGAMSESFKRNLGTLLTIAAAIFVCTVIARSMKQPSAGESVTEVASMSQVGSQQGPALNAPLTDAGMFQPSQVQVSAPVGNRSNGLFTGLPAVEEVAASTGQFANQVQQQVAVLQQGVQAGQNQFQPSPDPNQNRLLPGSGVVGNPYRGDLEAAPQPNTPANPNFKSAYAPQANSQNAQIPGRQLWPADPSMTLSPNPGAAVTHTGDHGRPGQHGGPFGNPFATGRPNPSASPQNAPAAVDPAQVWPQLQLNSNNSAAGGTAAGAFAAPGATSQASPQLPVMPAMPSVHSFNDKTAANAYPATPQSAFPTLDEMNASLQRQKMERNQIRIGSRPAAPGSGPQAYAPNTNLNHGGALR